MATPARLHARSIVEYDRYGYLIRTWNVLGCAYTLPMLIGGIARDKEDKKLKPRIDAIKEKEGAVAAEKQRALILLGTFMVAAGLLTGEAFFGTESSILSFIDSLWADDFRTSIEWHHETWRICIT